MPLTYVKRLARLSTPVYTRSSIPEIEGSITVTTDSFDLTAEERATRRQAKRRWAEIQARMDDRAYVEHLAMLEPDEPLLSMAMKGVSDNE